MNNTIGLRTNDTNTTSNNTKTNRVPTSELGKDDFLKLLLLQMQNQDPMSPMDDKDSIAQMAQFSALEQMTNMNTLMQYSLINQESSMLFSYSQLIGKEVEYVVESKDDTAEGEEGKVVEEKSVVKSVSFKGNEAIFELENGKQISISQIFKIADTSKDLQPEPII